MTDQELIAETNDLLKQVLEIQAERKREAEEAAKQFDADLFRGPSATEGKLEQIIGEQGLPEAISKGTDKEWENRREKAQKQTMSNIETLRSKEEAYRESVLNELVKQTSLLSQIAEKLEA